MHFAKVAIAKVKRIGVFEIQAHDLDGTDCIRLFFSATHYDPATRF